MKPYPYPALLMEFVHRCKSLGIGQVLSLGMTKGTDAMIQIKRHLHCGFLVEEEMNDKIFFSKSSPKER